MVRIGELTCPGCGGLLKSYGGVPRIVRTKRGHVKWVRVRRLKCTGCGSTHREIPKYLLPYKHYEVNIIRGVLNGTITPFDLDYEDYPCEMTMKRWKSKK